MSHTYIRTFLVASAAFLALEAGPVVASLATRGIAQPAAAKDFPRTWMPGQLFDFSGMHRSRRDYD